MLNRCTGHLPYPLDRGNVSLGFDELTVLADSRLKMRQGALDPVNPLVVDGNVKADMGKLFGTASALRNRVPQPCLLFRIGNLGGETFSGAVVLIHYIVHNGVPPLAGVSAQAV